MALSGTLTQYYRWNSSTSLTTANSTNADLAVMFNWNVTEQSIVDNYSKVSFSVSVKNINLDTYNSYLWDPVDHITIGGSGGDSYYKDLWVGFDGTQKLFLDNLSKQIKVGETVNIGSGSTTVYHNNSTGAATPYIEVMWFLDEINKQYSFTGSISLNSIARHAIMDPSFTIEEFKDDGEPTISYQVPSGMTAYIYLSLDGTGKTEDTHLETVSGEGTITYTFTAADQEKLWTIRDLGVTTKAVRFYIKSTFSGTTYREPSNWVNLTLDNYWPTLDPEVWDTNTDAVDRLTGNKYKLIRYYSNAAFNTGGQARKRATIDIQTTVNAGKPLDGATGVFEKVTSNVFDFNIRDSYGTERSATMELPKPTQWVDYVKLTTSVEATPMTAEGDVLVTLTGKFFNGDFGNKVNRMRMSMDLYKNNEEVLFNDDWGYIDRDNGYNASSGKQATFTYDASTSSYKYEFLMDGLEYLSVYELHLTLSDEVTNLSSQNVSAQTILASVPIFDWSRTDFNFNVPVTIQGWEVDRVVEQSDDETGYYEDANGIPQSGGYTWSYRKWSSGLLECWCSLPITTNVSSAWGSLYTSGRLIKTNLLFPREFTEVPVVTATLAAGYAGGILMTTGSSSKPVTTYAAGTLEIARGSSYSNASYTIHYMVKGRWK